MDCSKTEDIHVLEQIVQDHEETEENLRGENAACPGWRCVVWDS
jgi:hypothetical protein